MPEIGQYLQTEAGSTYLIIKVTMNTRPQAKSIAKLDMLKLLPDDIAEMPRDAIVHRFAWYSRRPKKG